MCYCSSDENCRNCLYIEIVRVLLRYAKTTKDASEISSQPVLRVIEKAMVLSGKGTSEIKDFSEEEENLAKRILILVRSNIPDKPKSPALTHVISSRCKS